MLVLRIKKFRVGVIRNPYWTGGVENNGVSQEQLPVLEEILEVLRKIGVTLQDPVIAANSTFDVVSPGSGNQNGTITISRALTML